MAVLNNTFVKVQNQNKTKHKNVHLQQIALDHVYDQFECRPLGNKAKSDLRALAGQGKQLFRLAWRSSIRWTAEWSVMV